MANKEYVVLEDNIEAFGKEEGGYQIWGGEKLKGQGCEPQCGTKCMELSFILAIIYNH